MYNCSFHQLEGRDYYTVILIQLLSPKYPIFCFICFPYAIYTEHNWMCSSSPPYNYGFILADEVIQAIWNQPDSMLSLIGTGGGLAWAGTVERHRFTLTAWIGRNIELPYSRNTAEEWKQGRGGVHKRTPCCVCCISHIWRLHLQMKVGCFLLLQLEPM